MCFHRSCSGRSRLLWRSTRFYACHLWGCSHRQVCWNSLCSSSCHYAQLPVGLLLVAVLYIAPLAGWMVKPTLHDLDVGWGCYTAQCCNMLLYNLPSGIVTSVALHRVTCVCSHGQYGDAATPSLSDYYYALSTRPVLSALSAFEMQVCVC